MASFGEELKRERELRDISLKEISEATKISIRFLEALEQNNFDVLPGGVFNRGFIRAYARFIGVDGEEMVNAYLHEVAVREARQSQPGKSVQRIAASAAAVAGTDMPAQPAPFVHRPAIPPETGFTARSRSRGGEARASVALWVLMGVALLVGFGVITMSFVGTRPVDASAEGHAQALRARLSKKAEPAPETATAAVPAPPSSDTEGEPALTAPPATDGQGSATGTAQEKTPAQGGPEAPPVPEHRLRVRALEITRVTVECGGKVVLDQELWPGQSRSIDCLEPVVLSAANAGGLEYSLDTTAPAMLGAVGQQIDGLTIAPLAPAATPESPTGQTPGQEPPANPAGAEHARDANARH